jgi:hypothetical protein
MKTLIASIFALTLLGSGAASADGIGLDAHVGGVGAGAHVGDEGVGAGAHVGSLGAGVGLHGDRDRGYYDTRYHRCSRWQWRHHPRYCRH